MIDVEKIKELVGRFARDCDAYCSPGYSEASVRKDFINPLFKALGWNVENVGLPPNMREVIVEEGDTSGRPDYAFCIDGQTKFFVEAKKPAESLDNVKHIMQAKTYAWNSKSVFIAGLTDFEGFKLYDASLKPDQHAPERGLIWDLRFEDYLDNLDKLSQLSKEEVEQGSLEKLLLRDKESKRLRIPVDEAFLEELTEWREELAKSYKKHTPDLDVYVLNEVVQRLLDRLVFIRICEDRRIIPHRSLEELVRYWKGERKRRDLMQAHLAPFFHKQNERFNGEILLPHSCEIYPLDSDLLANIIETLYFPVSPYKFEVIGVEILGTIYERYLGKTLHVTAKRAKLEDKPEVRKAGGVYYTPDYIVSYIVKNTLGKLLEPKDLTLEDVSKLRILDPACGSGSFLLAAYDKLLKWHRDYYEREIKEGKAKQTRMIGAEDLPYFTNVDGKLELTAAEKARILQNNIYGVDIDPQAVEITMMSLYIKLLEGEVHFPTHRQILPQLKRNIRCGNSLIGPDFYENRQGHLFDAAETRRINAFDWTSKEHGFGEIMAQGGFDVVIGNPPYGVPYSIPEVEYFKQHFPQAQKYPDSYCHFILKGLQLLRDDRVLSFIVPNTFCDLENCDTFREWLLHQTYLKEIWQTGWAFKAAVVDTLVFFLYKQKPTNASEVTVTVGQKTYKRAIFSFTSNELYKIDYRNTDEAKMLLVKANQNTIVLSCIATVKAGVKLYEKGKGTPPQSAKVMRERPFSTKEICPKGWKPLYRGEDVTRYHLSIPKEFVNYGPWLAAPRTQDLFVNPKILMRRTDYRLLSCLENESAICVNSCHVIKLNETKEQAFSYSYLLGILNSRLLQRIFELQNPQMVGKVFAEIKVIYVERLPIRTIDFNNPDDKAMHDRMVELVERMLKLNKELHKKKLSQTAREALKRQIDYTNREIDKLVYKLYNLNEEEIRIVEGGK